MFNRLYFRHLFSRYKLRGNWITWCPNANPGWVRLGRVVIRWEYMKPALGKGDGK